MNITKEQIDALNAVLKVEISREDYQDKVDKILKDYRRNANIPGFRKGQVPMGLIKKQYGRAVLVDEVNKLLQDNLNKYLMEEKLDVLGNPLPKRQDSLNWDAEELAFEFELGLAPDFEVSLKPKKGIPHYKIVADKKMIDDQVARIRKQYGKLVSRDTVGPDYSEKEMREKIKADSEAQFQQQSDQKLLNDITESLIENTPFDLPTEFLKKWMQTTGEKPLSQEEANDEFEKSEKGLRYQLIEGKLIKEHGLEIQFDELREFAKGFIKSQMAQYGQTNPKEEDLDAIAARVMSNQDEVRRLSEQLMSQKLLNLYKEKANLKTKEVTYEAFVKEVYG